MSSESLRYRAGVWIESKPVQNFIIALIVINAVTLGLQTSSSWMAQSGGLLLQLDNLILAVFVAEIGIKLFAFRLGFFKTGWNNFDFIVVGIALVPASGPLAVVRALRILRVLRMISMVPRLRFVVEALLHAIPGISSIGLLMLIIFYVFAVMATTLFGGDFPEWFGSIGASMYTLFQVMTLESWSMGIVRPVMELFPYAWLYFIPFILIATFTMLNLFIGIIVDTMQTMHQADHDEEREHIEQVVHEDTGELANEMRQLRAELAGMRASLGK
ncbi:voltage-gated sodium channel [Solemya pervernicosa gill symbiont]|uniref:Voltage-gated sodium channel n=2 Tax=Gammaproteobacteria incertae sedis TaxID=118884 RepID=A0A1T2L3T4_9GAMM|nr:ion transporter [Candidatus Reidiella endopervernicosa]OOZ39751.1 voltage-gated sodium channel [Solemya pervernicosa gill symbiont]QKQ27903.1 ion transporter [Candidatus Reidiella endopervernicosa]